MTFGLSTSIIIDVAVKCGTRKRYGSIAQLGEHLPYKQRVIGSSPIVPTTIFLTYGSIAQLGEHLPYKQRVIGSSPIVPTICGPVVQLVRMPACHAGGRGFEPHPDRHYSLSKLSCFASVAQSVEQGTENPRVVGSIPTGGTISCGSDSVVECHLAKVKVASSNLVFRSTIERQERLRCSCRHIQDDSCIY